VSPDDRADRALPARLEGRARSWVLALWGGTVLLLAILGTSGFVRVLSDPWIVAMHPAADVLGGHDAGPAIIACLLVAPAFASLVLCVVVWRRRPDDPMALLFSLSTLLIFTFGSRTLLAFQDVEVLRHAFPLVGSAAIVGLGAVMVTFPDGRAIPRTARWIPVAIAIVLLAAPDAIWLGERALQGQLEAPGRTAGIWGAAFGLLSLGGVAQVHRYRRVSGPIERQQARWVLLPLAAMLLLIAVALVAGLVEAGTAGRWLGAALLISLATTTVAPLAIGNAILRHRLWDLDRLISRTVTYALVVASLGLLYAGAVTALGSLVSRLGGADADLAVAASVLMVAASFHPLRTRVRTAVDHRFDRTGLERRQAIELLTHDLRQQVELDAIRGQITQATDQLVRPAHAMVWLASRHRR
jgi:hypothetical protein